MFVQPIASSSLIGDSLSAAASIMCTLVIEAFFFQALNWKSLFFLFFQRTTDMLNMLRVYSGDIISLFTLNIMSRSD